MTELRKAAEMALEALENVYGKGKRCEAAIEALRQALAQPEQEPVAWIDKAKCKRLREDAPVTTTLTTHRVFLDDVALYTALPKREWVGLTEAEREHFRKLGFVGVLAVEAKLKEKNG